MVSVSSAARWSRIIGWYEMILACLFIIVSVRDLNGQAVEECVAHTATFEVCMHAKKLLSNPSVGGLILYAFDLALNCLSFTTAAVLLQGSYNKNSELLSVWLLYALVVVVLRTFVILPLQYELDPDNYYLPIHTFAKVSNFILEICCHWVVHRHKREIDTSSKSEALQQDNRN